uniref:Pancreatic trypsin inhibitor n=1 Tax=Rhipicephalus zambeziensis TaxID=60191 RepID=A0A224Y2I9_9ACAR
MASPCIAPITRLLMLLFFLAATHAAVNLEERILNDPQQCNRRLAGQCAYPQACECSPSLGFGSSFENVYYFSHITNQCEQGGEEDNCNGGFTSLADCRRHCPGKPPAAR